MGVVCRRVAFALLGLCGTLPGSVSGAPALERSQGPALDQRALGYDTFFVRTPAGEACVVSGGIDIAASRYRGADGAVVAFESVARSQASSVQFIAAAPYHRTVVRVQLKYPVQRDAPVTLTAEGAEHALGQFLEPSGDSLRIDDVDLAALLRRVAETGGARLAATSLDTDRRVEDDLPAMRFIVFDACLAGAPGLVETARPTLPQQAVLEFIADPSPMSEARLDEAQACGVSDPSKTLHRGRIVRTGGFFTQTEDVFVHFRPGERLGHVYIPGILDAPLGQSAARSGLSVSANRNDPLRTSAVKGCFGAAPIDLCDMTGFAPTLADGAFLIAECFGGDLLSGLLDDAMLLSDFDLADDVAVIDPLPVDPTSARTTPVVRALPGLVAAFGGPSGSGGGFGGGGAGRGGSGGGRPGGNPNGGGDLSVVPTPPAMWALLGALFALGALRRRRRARASGAA